LSLHSSEAPQGINLSCPLFTCTNANQAATCTHNTRPRVSPHHVVNRSSQPGGTIHRSSDAPVLRYIDHCAPALGYAVHDTLSCPGTRNAIASRPDTPHRVDPPAPPPAARAQARPPPPSHLPQRQHVDVTEPSVPTPAIFLVTCHQTNYLCNVEVQHIQPVRHVIHQSQKPSAWLTDPHHTIVDIDLVSHLVELANTHNVSGELGNVVNTGGGSMLRNTYSEHQNAPRFHQ
jgi:hypothetical protein